MTDDVDLVRLNAYVEAAGAKLVLTGDHRQLGPVGPAEPSEPSCAATLTLFTTWPRTAASTTPKSAEHWKRYGTGTSVKP